MISPNGHKKLVTFYANFACKQGFFSYFVYFKSAIYGLTCTAWYKALEHVSDHILTYRPCPAFHQLPSMHFAFYHGLYSLHELSRTDNGLPQQEKRGPRWCWRLRQPWWHWRSIQWPWVSSLIGQEYMHWPLKLNMFELCRRKSAYARVCAGCQRRQKYK